MNIRLLLLCHKTMRRLWYLLILNIWVLSAVQEFYDTNTNVMQQYFFKNPSKFWFKYVEAFSYSLVQKAFDEDSMFAVRTCNFFLALAHKMFGTWEKQRHVKFRHWAGVNHQGEQHFGHISLRSHFTRCSSAFLLSVHRDRGV